MSQPRALMGLMLVCSAFGAAHPAAATTTATSRGSISLMGGAGDCNIAASAPLIPGEVLDTIQLVSGSIVSITAVPKPGTWAPWAAGLAGLGFVARRRCARPATLGSSMDEPLRYILSQPKETAP